MIDFNKINKDLKNISNFANVDNFDSKLVIIKSTLKYDKHIMLMGEDYLAMSSIYDDLGELERVELLDYFEFEKGYAGHN